MTKSLLGIIITTVFFIGCKPIPLENKLGGHFRNMNFSQVNVTDIDVQGMKFEKGNGEFKDILGKTIKYKWAILMDKEGNVGGIYLGSENQKTSQILNISADETSSRLDKCLGKKGQDLAFCVEDIWLDMMIDCHSAETEAEKNLHCWWKN